MSIGDLLEIVAGIAAVVGTLVVVAGLVSWLVGAGCAAIVASVFLLYMGQVWSKTPISRS